MHACHCILISQMLCSLVPFVFIFFINQSPIIREHERVSGKVILLRHLPALTHMGEVGQTACQTDHVTHCAHRMHALFWNPKIRASTHLDPPG